MSEKEMKTKCDNGTFCQELCDTPKKCVKTPLCGCVQRVVNAYSIYIGDCFSKSYGQIRITNHSEVAIGVGKNFGDLEGIIVQPNTSVTLTFCDVYEISLSAGGPNDRISICWEGCICNQICC